MIRLTDITFYANSEYADTNQLLDAQQAALLYIHGLKNKLEVDVVKHITSNTTRIIEKENIHFFVSKNKPGFIPRETIAHLKQNKPDIVFVHGLIFPLHIIRLAMILDRKARIVVWHHADRPQGWIKKIFQQLADRYISRYLFTSDGNAEEWLEAGIIANREKIFETPSTLSFFSRQIKELCIRQLQIGKGQHYLWIGRLDKIKDPLTVINGFEKFVSIMPSAKLHMIFQSGELLSSIRGQLDNKPWLKDHILLHGKVHHEELELWYSAADFLISGSLREAGSVVLLEAMACGCIPIVTAIPPSLKVTGDGKYGFSYAVGNVNELADVLASSVTIDREVFSKKIELHFEKEYSVRAIADKLYVLCRELTGK
ncbi:MAG: glycosyltransferase family 4 protein [Bacteroidota bacterium]